MFTLDNLTKLIKRNGLDYAQINDLMYRNILLTVFDRLILYLNKHQRLISFKRKILSCSSIKEEISVYENILNQITEINMSEVEILQIRTWMNASFTKGNNRVKLNDSEKKSILEKQDYKCRICPMEINKKTAHFDHIVPFKYVGDELAYNFQALCVNCSLSKGSNPIEFFTRFLNKKI